MIRPITQRLTNVERALTDSPTAKLSPSFTTKAKVCADARECIVRIQTILLSKPWDADTVGFVGDVLSDYGVEVCEAEEAQSDDK